MTKEELKDRISMALKDPVLQQGFEIICKENAELREEVKNNEDLATVAYMQGAEQQKKKADKQLAKAKEIIKDYMIIVTGGNITVCSVLKENRCINVLKLNEQAEEFLKERSENI